MNALSFDDVLKLSQDSKYSTFQKQFKNRTIHREIICGGDINHALNLWLVLKNIRPAYYTGSNNILPEISNLIKVFDKNNACYYVKFNDNDRIKLIKNYDLKNCRRNFRI